MVRVLKWRDCSDEEFGEILNKSNNWTHFLKNCGYRNTGNLEFLCPNCHAFTSTYRSKNNKKSS